MVIIVVSLADSICRHPDVTLESGLVPHTIVELFLRDIAKHLFLLLTALK